MMINDNGTYRYKSNVAADSADVLFLPNRREAMNDYPAQAAVAVVVVPTPGASAIVEATISAPSDVSAGMAVWEPWPAGTTTSQASGKIVPAPTALRCTATGGDVYWEVML